MDLLHKRCFAVICILLTLALGTNGESLPSGALRIFGFPKLETCGPDCRVQAYSDAVCSSSLGGWVNLQASPTSQPTSQPTSKPTSQPTSQPTAESTHPTPSPPVLEPTATEPTLLPTPQPPLAVLSTEPTVKSTPEPHQPTPQSTALPVVQRPTAQPTAIVSAHPTARSDARSADENSSDVAVSTALPTTTPTMLPAAQPTSESQPTPQLTDEPTAQPTAQRTTEPSAKPTVEPTAQPSRQPTLQPTAEPTEQPTVARLLRRLANPTDSPGVLNLTSGGLCLRFHMLSSYLRSAHQIDDWDQRIMVQQLEVIEIEIDGETEKKYQWQKRAIAIRPVHTEGRRLQQATASRFLSAGNEANMVERANETNIVEGYEVLMLLLGYSTGLHPASLWTTIIFSGVALLILSAALQSVRREALVVPPLMTSSFAKRSAELFAWVDMRDQSWTPDVPFTSDSGLGTLLDAMYKLLGVVLFKSLCWIFVPLALLVLLLVGLFETPQCPSATEKPASRAARAAALVQATLLTAPRLTIVPVCYDSWAGPWGLGAPTRSDAAWALHTALFCGSAMLLATIGLDSLMQPTTLTTGEERIRACARWTSIILASICFLEVALQTFRVTASQTGTTPAKSVTSSSSVPNQGVKLDGFGLNVQKVYHLRATSSLHVCTGDITQFRGSAIVNSSDELCLGNGGEHVDRAITAAGGSALASIRKGFSLESGGVRVPRGSARIGAGGSLKAQYCIHAVGPDYRTDTHSSLDQLDEVLVSAYQMAMECGRVNKLPTIAVPLLSAQERRNNRQLDILVRKALEGISSRDYSELRDVFLVAHDFAQLQEILKVCDARLSVKSNWNIPQHYATVAGTAAGASEPAEALHVRCPQKREVEGCYRLQPREKWRFDRPIWTNDKMHIRRWYEGQWVLLKSYSDSVDNGDLQAECEDDESSRLPDQTLLSTRQLRKWRIYDDAGRPQVADDFRVERIGSCLNVSTGNSGVVYSSGVYASSGAGLSAATAVSCVQRHNGNELKATGAGNSQLNQIYTKQGMHDGRSIWKAANGASIEWWRASATQPSPMWWLRDNSGSYFCGVEDAGYLDIPPATGWRDGGSGTPAFIAPAPTIRSIMELNPFSNWRSASSFDNGLPPGQGSPEGMLDGAPWRARSDDQQQWYEIDLQEAKHVTGVVLQGNTCNPHWYVKQFHVLIDDKPVEMEANGLSCSVFDAGTLKSGTNDIRQILFSEPVYGQRLRIVPLTWEHHITLRVGVLVLQSASRGQELRSFSILHGNPSVEWLLQVFMTLQLCAGALFVCTHIFVDRFFFILAWAAMLAPVAIMPFALLLVPAIRSGFSYRMSADKAKDEAPTPQSVTVNCSDATHPTLFGRRRSYGTKQPERLLADQCKLVEVTKPDTRTEAKKQKDQKRDAMCKPAPATLACKAPAAKDVPRPPQQNGQQGAVALGVQIGREAAFACGVADAANDKPDTNRPRAVDISAPPTEILDVLVPRDLQERKKSLGATEESFGMLLKRQGRTSAEITELEDLMARTNGTLDEPEDVAEESLIQQTPSLTQRRISLRAVRFEEADPVSAAAEADAMAASRDKLARQLQKEKEKKMKVKADAVAASGEKLAKQLQKAKDKAKSKDGKSPKLNGKQPKDIGGASS